MKDLEKMIIKFVSCSFAIALLGACQTTANSTAGRQTMQQRLMAQNAVNSNTAAEPMPPAEGPEDVPAAGQIDPNRNPSLLPTPLLRGNAAGSL